MFEKGHPRRRVAVIGSGLAGLTAAYLLHNDSRKRYEVIVLESGPSPSLDAASLDLNPRDYNGEHIKVDVPMRAFTGGYYRNLMAMYDHLGIQYQRQKFRFEFYNEPIDVTDQAATPYFIHSSENHEFPPPRPTDMSLLTYGIEVLFISLCFLWFMACCQWVLPRGSDETLDYYVRRIRLPRRFISWYLLPLMSAVATCSHQEMLAFPASDVVQYRKLINRQKQYVVTGGVKAVQQVLTRDLDIRFHTRAVRIVPTEAGLEVVAERIEKKGHVIQNTSTYDHVIAAVPPNIVAGMFEPASSLLSQIPVRSLETIVHRASVVDHTSASKHLADRILLKTSRYDGWTEATHLHPDGTGVTSCPLAPLALGNKILSRPVFTRTLRTPESRKIIRDMLGCHVHVGRHKLESRSWRNGDDGLWLVGAWCFDGMVLLEGAVASAMHVAKAFGVDIPWEHSIVSKS